jgi:hypothetical protein
MKLWIDDCRPAPEGWVLAKSAIDAICKIALQAAYAHDPIEEISFDHDLGYDLGYDGKLSTGAFVAKFVATMVIKKGMRKPIWHVHSQNPWGANEIRNILNDMERGRLPNETMVF